MWASDEWTEYTGSIMTIELSGRGEDETNYAVIKYLHGGLYLLDCGGFRSGYSEPVLKALAHIAKENAVNAIVVEPNFADGMCSTS
jgi:hypothetical protein